MLYGDIKLRNDAYLFVASGDILENNYNIRFKLCKNNNDPIFVLINRDYDCKNEEMLNYPLEIYFNLKYSDNHIVNTRYTVIMGSTTGERYAFITMPLHGFDDTYMFNFNKNYIQRLISDNNKYNCKDVVLEIGIRFYRNIPVDDDNDEKVIECIYSEPLYFKTDKSNNFYLYRFTFKKRVFDITSNSFGFFLSKSEF